MGDAARIVTPSGESLGERAEEAGGLFRHLRRREIGPERFRVAHDRVEDAERLLRCRREVGEREPMDARGRAREVRVHFEAVEVADDEEGRVVERLAVVVQLAVGGREVLALALVLPGEVAALPDVGEAVTSAELLGTLLERVRVAGRIGLVRRRHAEHPAQVDEVLLGGGPLGPLGAGPLGGELARRHRRQAYGRRD